MTDPVEAQLTAYNAHDVDAFAACFADDVVITAPDGTVHVNGRDELRTQYGTFFASSDVRAEIVGRMRAGDWVVDHERVTRAGTTLEVLVAYEVHDDLITRMIALR